MDPYQYGSWIIISMATTNTINVLLMRLITARDSQHKYNNYDILIWTFLMIDNFDTPSLSSFLAHCQKFVLGMRQHKNTYETQNKHVRNIEKYHKHKNTAQSTTNIRKHNFPVIC